MANLNPIVLTKKGLALLAKLQAQEDATMKLTRIGVGDGSYTPEENLSDATALKSEKQTFDLVSKTVINQSTVSVKAVISNQELEEGYCIKEIGLYAEDPDDGEILYALTTAKEGQWDYLPPFNNQLPSTITLEAYIEVSDAERVQITVKEGTYALSEDLEAAEERLGGQISTLSYNMEVRLSAVEEEVSSTLLPQAEAKAAELIAAHNTSPDSHTDIRQSVAAVDARTALLELIVNTDISGNPFSVTFADLASVTVTGVHNTALQRIEF